MEVSYDAEVQIIDEGLFGIGAVYRRYIYCDVTFINSGTASGQKCVTVSAYLDGSLVKTQTLCETVGPGDHETERMTYTQDVSTGSGFKYMCEKR